jgi:hypothetical protein
MATTDLLNNPVPVPCLGTQGFIYDSASKFDQILAHIFASDVNQTYLYPDRITSLAAMIEKGGSDKLNIEQVLQNGFLTYLNHYYQDVNVELVVTDIDNSTSRLDFQINITVTENAQQFQYGALIRTVKKQLEELIKLNNYGK